MQEITNDEANELADEILLRNEFLGAREPGFFSRSVNWVLEQIGDALSWLIGQIFGGSGGGAGSALAVVLLVVALIVLGLAIYRAIVGWKRAEEEDEPLGARVVFDEVVDPGQLRAELARYRAGGDWRGAVIAGFRLAVISLIDQRIAGERPGATTGDFGRAVEARRPELSSSYERASTAFERAFYSDGEIVADDAEAVDALLGRLDRVPTA